jgi:hypothetical protein
MDGVRQVIKYRLEERSFVCFAPSFKSGLFRRYLSEGGNVLPRGVIWSGPLEMAAQAIRNHMTNSADKWLEEDPGFSIGPEWLERD